MVSKKQPKVTIVTVVFNGGDCLEKTIESIVRQSYANKEYIVVDGGSTDGTRDVIDKYDDDIDKWLSENDAGLYDAMNKGIDLASGDWIIFMNCNDRFYDNRVIEKVFEGIEEDADFIYGDVIYRSENGRENYDKARPLDEMWKRISFSHQSLFTKTSVAIEKKFDLRYDIVADYKFYYEAYKDGRRFQYYPGPVGLVATGGVSDRNLIRRTLQRWDVVHRHERDVVKDKYYVKLLTDFLSAETGATSKSVARRIPAIGTGTGQRADSRTTVFTIVTPTYNCATTIDQTIQSVVTQIGPFFIQYVIVDGLSTDSTVGRIKHWQASLNEGNVKIECDGVCLKYICEEDEGFYDAIEKGFRNSDYRADALNIMTWINGDDFLTQGALATVCQVHSENDDVRWLTGIRQIFDNVKGMITPTAALVYPKYFLANGLCDGTHFPFLQQEGTFWTYELYEKVGGLDPKLKLVGDYDLWRRFGQEADLLVIDNVLGVFRKQPGQKSENIEEYKKEIDTCTDFDDRMSKFYEVLYKSEKKIEECLFGKKGNFSYGEGRWLFHHVSVPFESLPLHIQERYWKYRIARLPSEEKLTPAASSPDMSHRVEAKPNLAPDRRARVHGLARKLAHFALSPAARDRVKRWIRVRTIRRSGLFFSEFYREQIEKSGTQLPESNYIEHYVEIGAGIGYDPNPLFSSTYYLNTYKGVMASGENPLYHYIKIGHQLAMNPGPDFDTKFYRSHMRLAKNENPLVHYFKTGIIQDAPRKA